MKKILMLGASSFFWDAYKYAQQNGIYTIAVDMKDETSAICKKIADVAYLESTRDIKALLKIAEKEKVDGIYAGASETNMPVAIELSKKLNIPFYCGEQQWKIGTNKRLFKEMCRKYGIPITPFYDVTKKNYIQISTKIEYPVVTKPVDNNGSTGITICNNEEEFLNGYRKAQKNSETEDVLVEKFMPYNSVIIHYTMVNGKAYFCGMSDKISKKISDTSGPVMALQCFPAENQQLYIEKLDEKVKYMFEHEGFSEGPIWIEAFTNGKDFVFNEMGYRFGGSMTYHPVKYFTGIDQISFMMKQTLNEKNTVNTYQLKTDGQLYCIAPIHICAGKIEKIIGLDSVKTDKNIYALVQCHVSGDEITESGTVSQVFSYLHIVCDTKNEINEIIDRVLGKMHVLDINQNEMLFRIGKI